MKDPSLPLQKAIFDTLSAALSGQAGVYDRIPTGVGGKITADFPFVHIGEDQIVSDADQCHDPSTAFCTIHGWSRAVGKVEVKGVMAAVVLALDAKLSVEDFEIIGHAVEDLRHLTDPDGLTSHSVAVLRYRLGPVT